MCFISSTLLSKTFFLILKVDNNNFVEGDPRYLAAEVLHERKFSKAADIFALGVSILELLKLKTQFHKKLHNLYPVITNVPMI